MSSSAFPDAAVDRPTTAPLIAVRDLVVRLGDRLVLDGVSFEVEAGELLCVLGPSGCGKTTLLRALGGLILPASGAVTIGGQPAERGWARTAYVFQSPRLLPWRTALANVQLAQELRLGRADRARAERYLELCGIAEHGASYPAVLSGGERQRVALARALVVEPEVIFMDEPFSALDAATRTRLREELRGIWRREHRTIVFVTHDLAEAESLGTRILELGARPARVASVRAAGLLADPRPTPPSSAASCAPGGGHTPLGRFAGVT